jgi:hypothetical protein
METGRDNVKGKNESRGYSNPKAIIERHQAGETQSLTWAIREYIYLSIKAREAHGEEYFECPTRIASKFGCPTELVHNAMRGDTVVIRTGSDGDRKRRWTVCLDESSRQSIRSGYKRTPRRYKSRSVEDACKNYREGEDDSPVKITGTPVEITGKSTPQTASKICRATEYTHNTPPSEDTANTRPEAVGGERFGSKESKREEAVRLVNATLNATTGYKSVESVIATVGLELAAARLGDESVSAALKTFGGALPSSSSFAKYRDSLDCALMCLKTRDVTLVDHMEDDQ